jgi:hypothetical protein
MTATAFCVEYITAMETRRRIRYQPRPGDGYWRVSEQYADGEWRFVGRECIQAPTWTLEEVAADV